MPIPTAVEHAQDELLEASLASDPVRLHLARHNLKVARGHEARAQAGGHPVPTAPKPLDKNDPVGDFIDRANARRARR